MSRDETDREDLLREATALVERAELRVAHEREPVILGFRPDGAVSVFFGADPVYQFKAAGELRRAYCDGLLFKADGGKLAALERRRDAGQVVLARRDLDAAETADFLARMSSRLAALRTTIDTQQFKLVGQVPPDADVVGRIRAWLATIKERVPIAQSPRAK